MAEQLVKEKNANHQQVVKDKPSGLGTFGGVFTPSILTILGVIMYLRFGWVVGNVGLFYTLIIVTLSTSITFLTALSIASIATDQVVRVGGAYFMISRSLGIETGGAIGIPLYLAQALSIALYTIGFAESLTIVFPNLDGKLVGLLVTAAVGVLALFSTQAAIRSQYIILVAIGLSLFSLFFGEPLGADSNRVLGLGAGLETESFWVVFAVFFPAVTGIMAGVNMSGDLKDPTRSIPKGTFLAVATGYIIYMVIPFFLAFRADASTLIEDPLIMTRISFWGDAILLGVWGATLSSAVGSILGAPRILQAMAKDQVLPPGFSWLAKGSGPDNIPRAGTIFSVGIALVAVYLGNLDIIAPILSMFFLTTYGVLNIVAGVERLLKSPSFRPSFKVHWSLSILGAIGCIAVMFLINALATVIAILFVAAVFIWLKRRGLKATWGDVRRGIWLAVIRTALLRIDATPDPKNWRPNILVLSGAPTRRWHLIELANDLTHGQALMTVSTILSSNSVSFERVHAIEANIRDYLQSRQVSSLVRVIAAPDPFVGSMRLVDSYGLGALVPNTILLGDTREISHHQAYCQMIDYFHQAQRNVIIVRDDDEKGFGERKQIDVWWSGLKKNGGLMMILAYLLQTGASWQNVVVNVKMVVPTPSAVEIAHQNLAAIIKRMRIDFQHQVIVAHDRSFWDILQEESQQTDLVMLGLAEPSGNFQTYYEQLTERTQGLPTTVFVLAAQELAFENVLS